MDVTRFFRIADIKLALGFDGQPPGSFIQSTWMEGSDNLSSVRETVAKNPAPKGTRKRRGTNGHDSYLRDAVRVRAQHAAAQGGYRVNYWYCDRVVRLLPLRHGSRAHFRQAVLSQFGSADGDARRLRNLFHRLCRAPDRRCDLRPLRRPHRPQGDADCNAVVHGHRHLIAFVPTYETIGIWGAVLLTVLRMI